MKDEPMLVELRFPVLGTAVPLDHGYALYAAVSRAVPALHEGGIVARIGPISGNYVGDGSLALHDQIDATSAP